MAKLKGDFSQIKVINGPLLPIAFIPNSSAMQLKTILQRRMYLCAICQSKKKGLPDVVANLCSYKISNIKFERRKMFLFQLSNLMCFFKDSEEYIDILSKKIVLLCHFPIPILILFPVTSNLSIGFLSPPKICKSPLDSNYTTGSVI